jgi:acetyltransferase-like isoleucine patch superfamily enzyme
MKILKKIAVTYAAVGLVCLAAMTSQASQEITIGDFEGGGSAQFDGWTDFGDTPPTWSAGDEIGLIWKSKGNGSAALEFTGGFTWAMEFHDVTQLAQLAATAEAGTGLIMADVNMVPGVGWGDTDWAQISNAALNTTDSGWLQTEQSMMNDPFNTLYPGSWISGYMRPRTITWDFSTLLAGITPEQILGGEWANLSLSVNSSNSGTFYIDNIRLVVSGGEQTIEYIQWNSASGGNDHMYEVVVIPEGISWSDANAAALAKGGYLVTLTSEAENTFVKDILVVNPIIGSMQRSYWTGGVCDVADDSVLSNPGPQTWHWNNGDAFTYERNVGNNTDCRDLQYLETFTYSDALGFDVPEIEYVLASYLAIYPVYGNWNDQPEDGLLNYREQSNDIFPITYGAFIARQYIYGYVIEYDGITIDASADVSPSAVIGVGVTIEADATVGANSTIEANATIGANSTIGENTIVGESSNVKKSAIVGDNSTLGSNVTVSANVEIGDNTVIGDNTHIKITTKVGNDVEIGSGLNIGQNVSIGDDVSIGNDTIIMQGTIIEAGAWIGEGCVIGKNVTIGAGATIGNNVDIKQNVEIEPNTVIEDGATVTR